MGPHSACVMGDRGKGREIWEYSIGFLQLVYSWLLWGSLCLEIKNKNAAADFLVNHSVVPVNVTFTLCPKEPMGFLFYDSNNVLLWHVLRSSCWPPALINGAHMEFALESRLSGQHVVGFRLLGNPVRCVDMLATQPRPTQVQESLQLPLRTADLEVWRLVCSLEALPFTGDLEDPTDSQRHKLRAENI